MGIKTDFSGQYAARQGELLISEGDKAAAILLMLKGRMNVYLSPFETSKEMNDSFLQNESCRLFTLKHNTFLGVNDILNNGHYSFSIKSVENSNLYCFPASSIKDIKNMILTQKDYSAYIVSSLSTLIDLCFNAYQRLLLICQRLRSLTQNISVYYWAIKDKYYFQYSPDLDPLEKCRQLYEDIKASGHGFFPVGSDLLDYKFDIDTSAKIESELDVHTIEYFSDLPGIPMEQRKGFFSSSSYVCEYHIQKGAEVLDSIIRETKSILTVLFENMDDLYLSEKNLFSIYRRIVNDSREDKEAMLNSLNILEQISDILITDIVELQREFELFHSIETSKISNDTKALKANLNISDFSAGHVFELGNELPGELESSLENILNYCGFPEDFSSGFNKRLSQFRSLKDKTSNDPDARELRTSLTLDFFTVYEAAFKRTQKDSYCPKLISMFLNFGYMDERLLTKEQTIALYRLCDKEYSGINYSIYRSKEWLEQIYHHAKLPSVNDFGQDYFDIFREMKKRKILTDQDRTAYESDGNAKLNFEINNMLKTNQKVCHGHISSYFPILYRDIITRDLEKAVVTPVKIQQALDKILATDFSIFYREIWYKNDEKGIEKEPIMKEVLPEIILVPTFGSRPSMWQEITGRSRNTPGRFILPAFTDEKIDDMILKLIGVFRWELCRTMMGVAWNDITEKSLTSEYTDYIQFYKKNTDLSEDAKEKIKVQIQKNRNMMKDIFTSDYDTWINYESKGILRLNKVARSILFRYCPLPKELRSNLEKQPVFSDLVMKLNHVRNKTAKSLAGKYAKIFKDGEMDRDMELNLIFYRDL